MSFVLSRWTRSSVGNRLALAAVAATPLIGVIYASSLSVAVGHSGGPISHPTESTLTYPPGVTIPGLEPTVQHSDEAWPLDETMGIDPGPPGQLGCCRTSIGMCGIFSGGCPLGTTPTACPCNQQAWTNSEELESLWDAQATSLDR